MNKTFVTAVAIIAFLKFGCHEKAVQRESAIFEKGELLPSDLITGKAWHRRLLEYDSLLTTVIGNEEFEAGSRNVWHSHPGGQLLIVTDGVGYHQIKGGPIQVVRKGDVVKCPPGAVHWHGASKDSGVTQIYILPDTNNGEAKWFGKVTDEEYNSVKEQVPTSAQKVASQAIFPKGQLGPTENFTGKAWNYGLVNTDSIYNSQVGNVYFEPGARSNWHTHPAGQILIITDGVGYHQINGQPRQTLKKGDVVKCPPNMMHWHGASPDTGLQQMYIVPNTEKGIVKWLHPVTEEMYRTQD